MPSHSPSPKSEEVIRHYASGYEADRLNVSTGQLERERTRELLTRFLPPAPAIVLDVGGGPGAHACWLAKQGYTVHLIDIVPSHVEKAIAASALQPDTPLATASVGDARSLQWKADAVDAILLFGPLYHLTAKQDRGNALREAHRILKPGGVLLAIGISRFASTMDGIRCGYLKDPHFATIAERDLEDGQHRNRTPQPEYFMDTFFHHPAQLQSEAAESGFTISGIYGVEGPGWLVPDFDEWWIELENRKRLLKIAQALECEPSLLGINAHLMLVAHKPL
jgi:ubiquinone/menaquinone biosynthesis C-methylase UbiE